MADMSAFSLFFLQSPSFLAHQRRLEEAQGRSNCQTLFGLDQIPSDNHVRALLDPVDPDHFHPVFAEVLAELERSGGLKDFRQLGGHGLIALDGTQYPVSNKVRCQRCSTRKRGKDRTEHFHAMVSATIVAPDHNRVVPLEPEFIEPARFRLPYRLRSGRRSLAQGDGKMGTRGRFFENLRSITTFLIFPTWDDLLATLAFARPPPVAS